jgi:hypothetical protein
MTTLQEIKRQSAGVSENTRPIASIRARRASHIPSQAEPNFPRGVARTLSRPPCVNRGQVLRISALLFAAVLYANPSALVPASFRGATLVRAAADRGVDPLATSAIGPVTPGAQQNLR